MPQVDDGEGRFEIAAAGASEIFRSRTSYYAGWHADARCFI